MLLRVGAKHNQLFLSFVYERIETIYIHIHLIKIRCVNQRVRTTNDKEPSGLCIDSIGFTKYSP
jgi:hypothetical protein